MLHHLILFIRSSDDVNESIKEIIVCSKGCSAICNVRHLLNKICAQIKNEHVLNGFALRKVHIITRYDNQLIEGNINSPSEFKLFIQLILINIFQICWFYACPIILFMLALIALNISADCL